MRAGIVRKAAAAVIAFFVSVAIWGQDSGYITLYGHVSDTGTSESLFFASVNLSGTSISNVSNSDGYFSLKIPAETAGDAGVLVSHLGYQTGVVTVSSFAGSTASEPQEIQLVPTSIRLDPATVRSIDAGVLFRSALYRIKDNYPAGRVGMTAFYREMIRKGTTKYLVLNEAVIDIDKSSYSGFAPDRVGIYKGRGSTNYEVSDTLFVKLQGGITTALDLDQAKHPFAGADPEEVLKVYTFSLDGVVTYDGYSFYKLDFAPADNVEELMFRGSVFIEVESLAIGRVEMEMALEGREEEAARIFVLKRPQNTLFFTNKAEYVVSYKCFEGKWYYDYCRADVGFSTRRKTSLFRNNFSVTEEMAVTDHHKEGGIAIEPSSRVRFKDVLSDKVVDFADENFWEDYNIIEPDQSIDAIIRRIVRQLGRRR